MGFRNNLSVVPNLDDTSGPLAAGLRVSSTHVPNKCLFVVRMDEVLKNTNINTNVVKDFYSGLQKNQKKIA